MIINISHIPMYGNLLEGDNNLFRFRILFSIPTINRIHLMCWNQRRGAWDEGGVLSMQNMYTITGFAWKSDGSTLLCANMLGGVISIDCAVRVCLVHFLFLQIL